MRLTFASDSDSPFVPVGLELLERFCGLTLTSPDPGAMGSVDIYHGSDTRRPCKLRIPTVDSYAEADVPGEPDQAAGPEGRPPGESFPFDLLTAIRFWLADEGNAAAGPEAFDAHERLVPVASAQRRRGLQDTPIVNAYMFLFGEWLESRFGSLDGALPEGKRCVVVLSHDVDDPFDPTLGEAIAASAKHLASSPTRSLTTMGAKSARYLAALAAGRKGGPDRHWLFEQVMESEGALGFTSTFFFAATSRWAAGSAPKDVPSTSTTQGSSSCSGAWPALDGKWACTSCNARQDWRRIAEERELLEEVAEVPVLGSRHHFWRMQRPFWPTLADHHRAGLRYDSSVAFNDEPGYRLGVAFPFHPFDPQTGERIGTLQIPPMTMDGALLSGPDQTIEGAVARMDDLLDKLKQYQGVAAIDWHARTSFPGSARHSLWGETYQEILRLLAADPEVLVQSCGETLEMFG